MFTVRSSQVCSKTHVSARLELALLERAHLHSAPNGASRRPFKVTHQRQVLLPPQRLFSCLS